MANKELIVTTSDGSDRLVFMAAPPGHGSGVSTIIPNLRTHKGSQGVSDVVSHPDDQSWLQAGKSNLNAKIQLSAMNAAQECATQAYFESMIHGHCGTYLSPPKPALLRVGPTGAGQTTFTGTLFKEQQTKKRKKNYGKPKSWPSK